MFLPVEAYGVSPEHGEATLETCDQPKELVEFFQEFAKKPKGFAVLSGTNGCGKTYAACACMAKYLELGRIDCRFITMTDLNLRWMDDKAKGFSGIGLIGTFAEYELLVLDDLGIKTPSDGFLDFLYMLIDKRRSSWKTGTIVTTNLTGKQMRERYGDAIFSRVASGKCFRLEGEDRRNYGF